MQLSDYDYTLPDAAIAIHPPKKRGATRMLLLDKSSGDIQDGLYAKLDEYLRPGDLLIINNTKVLPARLLAKTEQGNERELLLLEQHGKSKDHHTSLVMYRRRLRPQQKLNVGDTVITVEEVFDNGTAKIRSNTDLWHVADAQGNVPLPPYLHRDEEPGDRERYQTEFAKEKGSVAAPTASLNLTAELLERIKQKGIGVAELTLHVGIGTFMPIRVEDVTKHKMHQEYFEISPQTVRTIQETRRKGGRIVAVGTTVTRTLEYAAPLLDSPRSTPLSKVGPWKGQEFQGPTLENDGGITGEADIFIYPGYEFRIVDGMLTNFHAPHSTVLMMAAAFAGWGNLEAAYKHALVHDYMFLSYGDSMLII